MNLINVLKNRKRVLGRNERNLHYIRPYNGRKAKRIADNKLLTKKVLEKAGIPVPKLIATVSNHQQLLHFNWDSLPD